MSDDEHFIVIVPGYMGSVLREKESGETVWIDIQAMLKRPGHIGELLNKLKYPNDNIEPAGIMEQGVLYALPWAKLDHYGRLVEHLRSRGFAIDPPGYDPLTTAVYRFAYDWRQDNRISGRLLAEAIHKWRQKHAGAKAWVIGHSNGGIISRWAIEKEGGKEDVERLFLMGSPWDGAPKSLQVLFEGYNIVGRRLLNLLGFNRMLSAVIRTFPSYYQLIPYTNPFLHDTNNEVVSPFDNPTWLDTDRDRQFLLDGLKFNQELGNTLSVDTVCYFGRQKPTTTGGIISVGPGGKWESIQWISTGSGDGTVPERSAVHPQAKERHAFAVDHGNIYVDEKVLTQLDFDLSGFAPVDFAMLTLDYMTIEFESDQDFYTPGEPIQVYTTLRDTSPETNPITDARITVDLVFREPLPGDEAAMPPANLPSVELVQGPGEPGTYRGSLPAPAQDGTYTLVAHIQTPNGTTVQIEETIAVEAMPEPQA